MNPKRATTAFSKHGSVRTRAASVALALCLSAVPLSAWAAAGDDVYYRIGGGGPVSASAGRGYQPGAVGLGIQWDAGSSCSGLDPEATIGNQLNGVTRGFQNLMGNVINSATGAVAALPAMVIQRVAPGLYDLLTNGVLQGKVDFNRARTSCREIAERAADEVTSEGWQEQARAENWEEQSRINPDAVAAQEAVAVEGGDNGLTWVGGEKRGGSAQAPIEVTRDTAVAGYNLLHGRTDPNAQQPVSGGGQGWGSVPTATGEWAGAGDGASGTSGCSGGMCTVWGSPDEAATWISDVVGERTIRTCSGCDKVASKAGTGLMRALEDQQAEIETSLVDMITGSEPLTPAALRDISAGASLSVSAGVIKALREDPQGPLLAHRLATEMALARTLTQALWARRILLAGADEPGIANNSQGQDAIDDELTHLDRGIQALRTEMEVRKSLADNAASVALERERVRNATRSPSGTRPQEPAMDSRDPM